MKFASSFISCVCLAATATANYAAVDQLSPQQQEELASILMLEQSTNTEVRRRKLKSYKDSKSTKKYEVPETDAPIKAPKTTKSFKFQKKTEAPTKAPKTAKSPKFQKKTEAPTKAPKKASKSTKKTSAPTTSSTDDLEATSALVMTVSMSNPPSLEIIEEDFSAATAALIGTGRRMEFIQTIIFNNLRLITSAQKIDCPTDFPIFPFQDKCYSIVQTFESFSVSVDPETYKTSLEVAVNNGELAVAVAAEGNIESESLIVTVGEIDSEAPSSPPFTSPTAAPSASSPPFTSPTTVSAPSASPSDAPTASPSDAPTASPSDAPTASPSDVPSTSPSDAPTASPSDVPSDEPSTFHSDVPSGSPSDEPSTSPSDVPSGSPSDVPSISSVPSTSIYPSAVPSVQPSTPPTFVGYVRPSDVPSASPSDVPSSVPSTTPSMVPTEIPATTFNSLAAVADDVSIPEVEAQYIAVAEANLAGQRRGLQEACAVLVEADGTLIACDDIADVVTGIDLTGQKCVDVATTITASPCAGVKPDEAAKLNEDQIQSGVFAESLAAGGLVATVILPPSEQPSSTPSAPPSVSSQPSDVPSAAPSESPTSVPSASPSVSPPTARPSTSSFPSNAPSQSSFPSNAPSQSSFPSNAPSADLIVI